MTAINSSIEQAPSSSHGLRALVLLGGSVRPGQLATKIGRPVFDLPLESGCTILNGWRREANALAESVGCDLLPIRVMLDQATPTLSVSDASKSDRIVMQIERDPLEYRGTGGVLRDLAAGYDDEDWLLVANAAHIMIEPLAELADALAAADGDVALIAHADGTPNGLLRVRCGVLRDLPAEGFIDMKEQALPAIASRHRVTVLQRPAPTGLHVRTLSDYVHALRLYHQHQAGAADVANPYAEDWESAFAIVEEGAVVHPSARLHDSVVLRGGCVEADAVVARSLVCPDGLVRRREMQIEQLVTDGSNGRHRG